MCRRFSLLGIFVAGGGQVLVVQRWPRNRNRSRSILGGLGACSERKRPTSRIGSFHGSLRTFGAIRTGRCVSLLSRRACGKESCSLYGWADVDLEQAVIRVRSSYTGGLVGTPQESRTP
jgi:hypothetical protein